MINMENNRFWMLPISKDFARLELESSSYKVTFTNRWLGWLVKLVDDYGQDIIFRSDNRQILYNEYENIISAIKWCRTRKRWKKLIELSSGIYDFMLVSNYFVKLNEIIDMMLLALRELGTENPKTLFQIGYYYWYRGPEYYELALPYFYRAREAAYNANDLLTLGRVLDCLSLIYYRQGNKTKALSELSDLTKIAEQTQDKYLVYLANFRQARLHRQDTDVSIQSYATAREIATIMGWERTVAWLDYYEAEMANQQKRYDEAEKLLEISRSKAKRLGEETLIALCDVNLCEIYLHTNRVGQLKAAVEIAIIRCDKLGMDRFGNQLRDILKDLGN